MDRIMRYFAPSLPACLMAAGVAWSLHRLDPPAFFATLAAGCWAGWQGRKLKEQDAQRMKQRVREALDELMLAAEQEAMGGDGEGAVVAAAPVSDQPRILPIRPFAPRNPRSLA